MSPKSTLVLTSAFVMALALTATAVIDGAAFGASKVTTTVPRAPVTSRLPPKFSALTVSECTSLGGTVNADSASCTKAGQFTCKTVTIDIYGKTHVHMACIDRK